MMNRIAGLAIALYAVVGAAPSATTHVERTASTLESRGAFNRALVVRLDQTRALHRRQPMGDFDGNTLHVYVEAAHDAVKLTITLPVV